MEVLLASGGGQPPREVRHGDAAFTLGERESLKIHVEGSLQNKPHRRSQRIVSAA